MIVVRQKKVGEILAMAAGHARLLVVGCNTCAAVSLAGGEREVATLAEVLRLASWRTGATKEFDGVVLQRQCEPEFTEELDHDGFDALISLGCGAGVALMSELVGKPVYPGADTLFIGAARGSGVWRAECSACGSCVLGETAGICPMTRCAKGILNGPCGGVDKGKCEADKDADCAWVLIHERLRSLGRLERFAVTQPPKDFSTKTTTRTWESPLAAESAAAEGTAQGGAPGGKPPGDGRGSK